MEGEHACAAWFNQIKKVFQRKLII
jgi:hypothetical protein